MDLRDRSVEVVGIDEDSVTCTREDGTALKQRSPAGSSRHDGVGIAETAQLSAAEWAIQDSYKIDIASPWAESTQCC
jgi:hypothetical protein